eukprot:CAMPEP_0179064998 /NCGR_PEP_ID=MMETSP0796-20121207/28232_1 /TAXON_ID=73915 /ORGANISM="Pyrodinium bahamense, Strain pbaha01" /LENGTH=528 /DNA_ID=CAMNT_0020761953 /DNA_START=53 /DNA_END=1639 /DNA_ORIENTATION=+
MYRACAVALLLCCSGVMLAKSCEADPCFEAQAPGSSLLSTRPTQRTSSANGRDRRHNGAAQEPGAAEPWRVARAGLAVSEAHADAHSSIKENATGVPASVHGDERGKGTLELDDCGSHQGGTGEHPAVSGCWRVRPGFLCFCGLMISLISVSLLWQLRSVSPGFTDTISRDTATAGPVDIATTNFASKATDATKARLFHTAAPIVFYGFLSMLCSVLLTEYNSFLMKQGRFPFAVNLSFGHQALGLLSLCLLFKFCPTLFPSLAAGESKVRIDWRLFFRGLLPIAFCFTIEHVLSNMANLYSSVAFQRMLGEGKLVLVDSMSLIFGLEVFDGVLARVLLCLLLSTCLTMQGDIDFSLASFFLQCSCQAMEALRVVLQASVLSQGGSRRLDPWSYNLLVQPLSALILGVSLCACAGLLPRRHIAGWMDYVTWWPHLVANALLALALNTSTSLFIAKSSSMCYLISGIVKDIAVIIVDAAIMGTRLSTLQVVAFLCQIAFILAYSQLKLCRRGVEDAAEQGRLSKERIRT